jgi:DNA-binding response OmpR family regulator
VKIVCVTASAYDTDEAAAMEAGADAFMKKPVRDVELLARIGELVGARLVDAGEASRAIAPPRPALSQLVQKLPADLVRELREAATAARARRLEELATRVSEHSEAAAAAIGDLVKQFRYDLILAALQGGSDGRDARDDRST